MHQPNNSHVSYYYVPPLTREQVKFFDTGRLILPFWRGGMHLAMHMNGTLGSSFFGIYNTNNSTFLDRMTLWDLFSSRGYPPITVIEDVVDTGTTIIEAKNKLAEEGIIIDEVFTIVAKPAGVEMCKQNGIEVHSIWTVEDDVWVVFPWEKNPQERELFLYE